MDPIITLKRIREITARILEDSGQGLESDAYELAELVDALDSWLTKGGFKPPAWDHSPIPA